MKITGKDADETLTWILQREEALVNEYDKNGSFSQFALDFVGASIERNLYNIEKIQQNITLMNHELAQAKTICDKEQYRRVLKEFNSSTASMNVARESLENCDIILGRMQDFITMKTKETA